MTIYSAFRPGYDCNTALLKVIEDWKKAVDNNLYVAVYNKLISLVLKCVWCIVVYTFWQ